MSQAVPIHLDAPIVVAPPGARLMAIVESLGVVVLGTCLMYFFYNATPLAQTGGGDIGVPEHDSWYHMKMAAMLPEWGLLPKFPWLQDVWWRAEGDAFVSHHFGFQLLLMPFVRVSAWLNDGDMVPGARLFCALIFGINLMLFNLLLRDARVPLRFLWLALFLLMPGHFFSRHAFVRAIGPSLTFLLLTVVTLFRGRLLAAAIVLALYVQLYLGGVIYGPLVVMAYALALAVSPPGERQWPWKVLLFCGAGWLLGVITYPYATGIPEFLRLQVFGSGLGYSVQVGREWFPYDNTWQFVQMMQGTLPIWIIAVIVRMRSGPPINAREMTLTLLSVGFLVLLLKSRRFVEYWPVFAMLSTAFLSAPALRMAVDGVRRWLEGDGDGGRRWADFLWLAVATSLAVGAILGARQQFDFGKLIGEWQLLAFGVAAAALGPIARSPRGASHESDSGGAMIRVGTSLVAGALVIAAFVALALLVNGANWNSPKAIVPIWAWTALGAAYAAVPLMIALPSASTDSGSVLARALTIGMTAIGLAGTTLSLGAPHFVNVAAGCRSYYDRKPVKDAMEFLEKNSAAGDIVFTDDWDVFCIYFYYNTHNYYIVGLDPEFTNQRRPDLWRRYEKITRAQVPATETVKMPTAKGKPQSLTIDIKLEDIREEFHAKFVIIDADHRHFADALAAAPALAEVVYPSRDFKESRRAPYMIFRIRSREEQAAFDPPRATASSDALDLTRLHPTRAESGFGEVAFGKSVDRAALRITGRVYASGIGTHANSTIVYEVPAGFDAFEFSVGVDDETDGHGSVIARVLLDETREFESPVLHGGDDAMSARLALNGAKKLTLEITNAGDGDRFDHADWVDVRFVKTVESQPSSTPAR